MLIRWGKRAEIESEEGRGRAKPGTGLDCGAAVGSEYVDGSGTGGWTGYAGRHEG